MARPRARLFLVAAIALGAVFASLAADERAALADEKEVSGHVLKQDAGDWVVDLGKKLGAEDGEVLELWRPMTVKNPVTGKTLTDRFRIGSLKIGQARDVLSLAKPMGPLLRPIEAGDIVIMHVTVASVPTPTKVVPVPAPPTPGGKPPPPPTTTTPTGPPPPPVYVDTDPDAKALSALFESLHGTDPVKRAEAYEAWVRAHPKSRFGGVLQEEIIALRKTFVIKGDAGAVATTTSPDAPAVRSFAPIDEVLGNTPLTIALEISGPHSGAVIHVHKVGEATYVTLPMKSVGPGYWSAVVPPDRIASPTLSFFVEAVSASGATTPILGNATEPIRTKVVDPPQAAAPSKHDNVFSMWTDYADYNRWLRNDFAWQTEGYFGMRFGDEGLRAIRSGFGVYQGKGGNIDDLDKKGLEGRKVGLSYGYVEAEAGFNAFWGLVGRAVFGLNEAGVTGGAQAFVRIGNDRQTNLLIGGEVLAGVGLRGITQIDLNLFPRFPILFRTEVTNQPAGSTAAKPSLVDPKIQSTGTSDLGFRAIAQAGFRITPGIALFVRGSYQGRNINHAGPGVGGGVTFAW